MPDLPIQQSQKEFESMARLQQARARDRQITENQSDDPADDVGNAELKTPDQPKKISKIGFVIMLILAIIKDVGLDMLPASVFAFVPIGTIVYFLAWIIGYLIIAIIYIWAWSKGGKRAEYKIFLWLIGTIFAESIPLLKDVATSLIFFVIWVYIKNTKEVGKFKELSAGAAKSTGLIMKALKYIPK